MEELLPYDMGPKILNFVSTEIVTKGNGKISVAKGTSNVLSPEQINVLSDVNAGTEITVNVNYRFNKTISPAEDISSLKFTAMVIPENEAECFEGHQQMRRYLKEKTIDKIFGAGLKTFPWAEVRFAINESGDITDVKLVESSGDKKTDQLLLEAIKKMPKWKPAENPNGMKLKQEFEFVIGTEINVGC
jgi:TonB family protein